MASGIHQVIPYPPEQISDNFLQLSMAIDQIRVNTPILADQDAHYLGTIARQLDECSDKLSAAAIAKILNKTQANVPDIVRVTREARDAVEKADTIRQVFSIAGAALSLAAAIMSGNADTIASRVGSLAHSLEVGTHGPGGGNPVEWKR